MRRRNSCSAVAVSGRIFCSDLKTNNKECRSNVVY